MGLAPTALWKVPPIPPLPQDDPSLAPQPFPPLSLPFPPGPLAALVLLAMLRREGAQTGVGEGFFGRKGGGGGGPLKRHLGPDPHLGELDERDLAELNVI